jgi:hypothetical protein
MAGEINTLHNSFANGYYSGSSSSGGVTASISYDINFGNYQTYLDSFALSDGINSITVHGSGTGSLNSSNGSFGFDNYYVGDTAGSCAEAGCAVSGISGQLNPVSGLNSAIINFNGEFNSNPVSGTINTPGSVSTESPG